MEANTFDVNDPFLFIIAGLCVLVVIAMAVFFLIRSWKRAKAMGFEAKKLRKIAASAAIFTIAPAIGIAIGVITLSVKLGLPLPWVRLSVVGSITYELAAAETTANAVGTSLTDSASILNSQQFVTIAWVMTLGIIIGIVLIPLLSKKILKGVDKIKKKDSHWGEIFMAALFMGMISAFTGYIFADTSSGLIGWIPVFVFIVSAIIMLLCALLMKKAGWKWLQDYALPISMIGSMALAIPITNLVTSLAGGAL